MFDTTDDASPFDLWPLEVHEQTNSEAGSAQVVDALRHMLVSEAFSALQLYSEHVFDDEICEVLTDADTFVMHGHRILRLRCDATKSEFSQKGSFVDLLQKTGTQCVGNFKDRGKYALGQEIRTVAQLRLHRLQVQWPERYLFLRK